MALVSRYSSDRQEHFKQLRRARKGEQKSTEQKLKQVHSIRVPKQLLKTKNSTVSFIIHECIRRVIRKHGCKKRWRPLRRLIDREWFTDKDDDKSLDPSTDSDMAMAGSLISLNTVYEFRLVSNAAQPANLASSVGGVIAGFQSADPSGGGTWTASEWAALTSLFSEVQMSKFTVEFWPVRLASTLLAGSAASGNGLVISGVLSTVTVAPAAWNAVNDNADAKIYSFANDTTHQPFSHTIVGTDLSWAIVTTPNPGSFAGCPGSIQYFGNGFIPSTALLLYQPVGYYKFRSRI